MTSKSVVASPSESSLSDIIPNFACRCLNVRVRCIDAASLVDQDEFSIVENAESFSIQHGFLAQLKTSPPWTVVSCRLCPLLDNSTTPIPILQVATQQTSNSKCMLIRGNCILEKEEIERLMQGPTYSRGFRVCLPEQIEMDASVLESKLHQTLSKTLVNHLLQKKLEAEERIASLVEAEQSKFDKLVSDSQTEMETLLNAARISGTLQSAGSSSPSPSLSRQNSSSQLTTRIGGLRLTPAVSTLSSSLSLGARSMSFESPVGFRPNTPESNAMGIAMSASYKASSLSRSFAAKISSSPGGTSAYSFSPPRSGKGLSTVSGLPRFPRGPMVRDKTDDVFEWEQEPGAPAPIPIKVGTPLQVEDDGDYTSSDEEFKPGTSMPIAIPEGFKRSKKQDSDSEDDGKLIPPHVMSYKASLKERGDFVVPESLSRRAAFQT